MAALGGVTRTDATAGGMTVIAENPETPPELAAMRTLPVATAVTTPLLLTVAMLAFSVFQKILAPDTGWPLSSSALAESETEAPSVRESLEGVTVTFETLPDGPVDESPPHESDAAMKSPERSHAEIDRPDANIRALNVARIPRTRRGDIIMNRSPSGKAACAEEGASDAPSTGCGDRGHAASSGSYGVRSPLQVTVW